MTAGPHFSLGFSRALGKVIVHVHGALEAGTTQELEDRLVDIIDGQGNRHLVVDLKGMTFIDAAGISLLRDALKRMQENGGELVLSGPAAEAMRAFEAVGLDKVVTPAWAHPAHGDNDASLVRPGIRPIG